MLNKINRIIACMKEYFFDFLYLITHKDVILIYQMGKVGSSSIVKSLKDIGIYCIHTHRLNTKYPFTTKFQKIYQTLRAKMIKRFLKNKNIKIVTLTRDPIGRNLSGFFQNLEDFTYQSNTQQQFLLNLFFEKENSFYTINWFNNEIKKIFDIDVYEYSFPKDSGFQIIKKGNVQIFVTKIEQLNSVQSELGSFLGVNNFELHNTNESEKKWYSNLHKIIKKEINFPKEYIDDRYESRYMKHFYTDEEIAMFREKWLK
ncbi:putative capsular polysaccharide synthesis family protein [Salinibacillus xinjiangensis]|uniref:Capsular biosynthesis protein n=1 Tax=Salinibacillus xinjiangensis TaxID=1229268 RepID=A0A6G1X2B6_9BACI|nr:putative capsular polysaccharide synthesis family protein [Salinibacillus xinjiangensis]MRG85069.1 hypothetical protein [Salinibacillus xinjiangensis]